MTSAVAAIAESRPVPRETRKSVGSALLGLPLFLKVLVANVIVVLIGVGLGTWFTLTFVASPEGVRLASGRGDAGRRFRRAAC